MPRDSSNSYHKKCAFVHTLLNIKINFMWLLNIAQNIEPIQPFNRFIFFLFILPFQNQINITTCDIWDFV